MRIRASPSSSGRAMSLPVGVVEVVETAEESVAGGGSATGVARASLKTEEAMEREAEEQRSPVLCAC